MDTFARQKTAYKLTSMNSNVNNKDDL